jgi:hypothetical protein
MKIAHTVVCKIFNEEIKMKYLYPVLAILCVLFYSVCSCSTEEAATQIPGARSEAPVFLAYKAVSETEIDFEFSKPVKVLSLSFSPPIAFETTEEGSTIKVNFNQGPGPGEELTADMLVEDLTGNTTNVLVPFRTRNATIPALCINELRTEYSKPKAEFIEFKILEKGNLGALRVFIVGNTKDTMIYEFPSIDAAKGEYVTLHLRTTEEDKNRNEHGSKLDESGGADSSPNARDLWIPGSTKLLHKTDAVYVLDQDDKVIDAVMISESADAPWDKDYLAEAADFLFQQDAWKSAGGKISEPVNAVSSSNIKTAITRSISRDETVKDSNTAADWYVTANSGATPGEPNNPKRFEQ